MKSAGMEGEKWVANVAICITNTVSNCTSTHTRTHTDQEGDPRYIRVLAAIKNASICE